MTFESNTMVLLLLEISNNCHYDRGEYCYMRTYRVHARFFCDCVITLLPRTNNQQLSGSISSSYQAQNVAATRLNVKSTISMSSSLQAQYPAASRLNIQSTNLHIQRSPGPTSSSYQAQCPAQISTSRDPKGQHPEIPRTNIQQLPGLISRAITFIQEVHEAM